MTVSYSFNLSGEDGGLYGLQSADGKAVTITGDPGEVDCDINDECERFQEATCWQLEFDRRLYDGET